MNVSSVLNLLPSSNKEIKSFVEKVKDDVLEGDICPLELSIQLKCLSVLLEYIKEDKDIKDAMITEADKYGKEFDYGNCSFEVAERGVKYNYSNCGHSRLDDIMLKQEELKAEAKKIHDSLKNIKWGQEIPDPDTGELLRAPARKSTTSIIVKLNG